MSIKLSIDNQKYLLSGRPGVRVYEDEHLTIRVGQGSHGVNTRGVQDIVITQGDETKKLHLSRRPGRAAMTRLDSGEVVTATRK